ncbi:hypothetical protein QNI19_30425 [Cytophagaceae bacterium DM2B3-1]|uniref:Uncharacterized protein n=1 Tax=Xanthocytophaga flava TaxID=3048013 RepID=A0ABT7CU42_9BACT|nr:hypothetical protein [Xanthocytophaga flavus]MDJ1469161.1 hypothetical protein [Xanthocytophaga flavus]MDJ1497293.1 hypothetical protein [Xanthocytophaga flavus]
MLLFRMLFILFIHLVIFSWLAKATFYDPIGSDFFALLVIGTFVCMFFYGLYSMVIYTLFKKIKERSILIEFAFCVVELLPFFLMASLTILNS